MESKFFSKLVNKSLNYRMVFESTTVKLLIKSISLWLHVTRTYYHFQLLNSVNAA